MNMYFMMDWIEIIGISLTSIGTVLAGVWFIFSKVFKMGRTMERIDNIERHIDNIDKRFDSIGRRFDSVDKRFDSIDKHFGGLDRRVDNVDDATMALKTSMEKLPCSAHHVDITKIKTILVEKFPRAFSVFSMKMSPRKLNETGEKLFAAINGEQFLNEQKDSLFAYITANNPFVALDVEQLANAACMSLVPTPVFNSLKNYVYNEPTWTLPDGGKYDITIDDVCFVLSLRLRDMYLSAHPEISTQ